MRRIRLPLILLAGLVVALAFLWRDRLIDALESTFSMSVIQIAIYLFSTRHIRLIVFAGCLVVGLAAAWTRPWFGSRRRSALAAGVVSVLVALLLPYSALARLEVKYFLDPAAEVVFAGGTFGLFSDADLAWLAFDPARGQLYVCGNGTDVVLALDARSPGAALRRTNLQTDRAQFCGYIPGRDELVVYQRRAGILSSADAKTMAITRRVDVGTIASQGDESFIGYDPADDVLVVTSESGRNQDTPPGVVVNATSGELLGRFRHGPGEIGNLTMHPGGHFAYFAFFTHATGIVKFDVARREPVMTVQGDPRLDRLIVDGSRNELLVASPVHARILVYDALTLEPRAPIPTVFGARSFAIDHKRDLLFVTSLLSDELDVIDLVTRTSVARFRLGPWLRDVAVDEEAGAAYVTSRHGLYKVRYLDRRH